VAGTDDGLIHVTRDDGQTWKDVTPPTMTPWSKASQIEAGHFDTETAYASVDCRIADNKPLYLLHARWWKDLAKRGFRHSGVSVPDSVNEDTKQKGLLFAATELRVYASFNDGDQWQALQNNMPVTPIRDLVVHGDDLANRHARTRLLGAGSDQILTSSAYLFKPGETFAIRPAGMNRTPLPHEEPQEVNPPLGVVVYYSLKAPAAKPLKLELVDGSGAARSCAAICGGGPWWRSRSGWYATGSIHRASHGGWPDADTAGYAETGSPDLRKLNFQSRGITAKMTSGHRRM
jgi:hypothetical protein